MGINVDRRWLAAIAIIVLLAFAAGIKYQSYKDSKRQEEQILIEELDSKNTAPENQAQEQESLIQVYVCGEVEHPGIYQLEPGSRLHQVLEMAVALEAAELRYLGMARELIDGETIVVPAVGDVEMAGVTAISPMNTASSKVNINQASAEEMASKLSGIGPVLAQRIVDYRAAQGPFQNIEDLQQVSGIGDKKYNDIKDCICVR